MRTSSNYEFASDAVVELAGKLIGSYHDHLQRAKIAYLFKDKASLSKGKVVVGTASKSSSRDYLLHNFDFVIVLAEDVWSVLNEIQRTKVLDHELCHCIENDKGVWSIAPHDFEDFECIVDRYKDVAITLEASLREFMIERNEKYDENEE